MNFLMSLSAVTALLLCAACNTVEGVGEDVSAAGNALDESAEENNNYAR